MDTPEAIARARDIAEQTLAPDAAQCDRDRRFSTPAIRALGDAGLLELKAAAGEAAIEVTSAAMRACGGAAFSKQTSVERYFRDAHAGAVMAPTGDVLRELIGRALLGLPLF